MVSAKAGVRPTYAARRTADAAPVTAFTPSIPDNPSMISAGCARSNRVIALILSLSPFAPYSAGTPPGTPGGQTKPKLLTCGIRATLLISKGIMGQKH